MFLIYLIRQDIHQDICLGFSEFFMSTRTENTKNKTNVKIQYLYISNDENMI